MSQNWSKIVVFRGFFGSPGVPQERPTGPLSSSWTHFVQRLAPKGPTLRIHRYGQCFVRVGLRTFEPKIERNSLRERSPNDSPAHPKIKRKSSKNRSGRASRASRAQHSDSEAHFRCRRASKGSPRALPGVHGTPRRASWASLGIPGGAPGTPRGRPGTPRDTPEAPQGPPRAPRGSPGRPRDRFWVDFGCAGRGPGNDFGSIFASIFATKFVD